MRDDQDEMAMVYDGSVYDDYDGWTHDKTSRRDFSFFTFMLTISSCLAWAYRTHRYGACDDTPFA